MKNFSSRLIGLVIAVGVITGLTACGIGSDANPAPATPAQTEELNPLLDEVQTQKLIQELPDPATFATAKEYVESEQRMAAYESVARDASQTIADQLVDGDYGKTVTEWGDNLENSASAANPGSTTTARIPTIRIADGSGYAILWWTLDQSFLTDTVMEFGVPQPAESKRFSFMEPMDFQNYWNVRRTSDESWTTNLITAGASPQQLHDIDVEALQALAAVNRI